VEPIFGRPLVCPANNGASGWAGPVSGGNAPGAYLDRRRVWRFFQERMVHQHNQLAQLTIITPAPTTTDSGVLIALRPASLNK
jgi:hypothetical protein